MTATCCITKISVMRTFCQGKWRRWIGTRFLVFYSRMTAWIGHSNDTVNASVAGDAVQILEGIDREGICESSQSL